MQVCFVQHQLWSQTLLAGSSSGQRQPPLHPRSGYLWLIVCSQLGCSNLVVPGSGDADWLIITTTATRWRLTCAVLVDRWKYEHVGPGHWSLPGSIINLYLCFLLL